MCIRDRSNIVAPNDSKMDYDGGFDTYNDEMLRYCIQDVKANEHVYNYLFAECKKIWEKKPLFREGIRVEHKWGYYEMRMRQHGWKFDEHLAHASVSKWAKRMNEIEKIIEPNLKTIVENKGEIKEDRVYRKDGGYFKTALQHLVEDPKDNNQIAAEATRARVQGAYTKVTYHEPKMGQMESVKAWLQSIGWVPDDHNVKRGDPRKGEPKWIQTAPKLTTSSMEVLDEKLKETKLQGVGALIDEYYTLRSRRSVTEGWIDSVIGCLLYTSPSPRD